MNNRKAHIASFVLNPVTRDSRVIKTARAAKTMGAEATIFGVGLVEGEQCSRLGDINLVIQENYVQKLKDERLWGGEAGRNIDLLLGGVAARLAPRIAQLKPDILHTHDMYGLLVGAECVAEAAARGHKIWWVHDLHEYVQGLKGELSDVYKPGLLAHEALYLRSADQLITVSETLSETLAACYDLDRKPLVTYNTPPVHGEILDDAPDIRSSLGLDEETPLVIFIGGANALRGCETILAAVASMEGAHLAFLSQGAYVDKLSEDAKSIGFGDRFHVHPPVAPDDVATFIRTADIGTHGMQHYPNGEVAMPNKLFEYLQAGVPLAVSDVKSMKAFVEEHGVGEVFVAEDVASCAAALKRILENREKYTARITPELQQQFSWNEQEKKLHKVYGDLLSRTKPEMTADTRAAAVRARQASRAAFDSVYARASIEAARRNANPGTRLVATSGKPAETSHAFKKKYKKMRDAYEAARAAKERLQARNDELSALLAEHNKGPAGVMARLQRIYARDGAMGIVQAVNRKIRGA